MHEDLDDTVIVPPHRRSPEAIGVDEDTLVRARGEVSSSSAEERADGSTSGSAETGPAAEPAVGEAAKGGIAALVEPLHPSGQRRVPLTSKRLQDSLRRQAPAAASPVAAQPARRSPAEPGLADSAPAAPLPAPQPPAHGFRIGDRPPVILDVPALVGRRPTAPRIPGRVFPRLVRVASPRSEVSGTHLELHQEGSSVIVTDLRSTNGTVVRMPGARPVKLRQGESLVVGPGTLVDIGDGNILEILHPPRLTVPGDLAGEGPWQ